MTEEPGCAEGEAGAKLKEAGARASTLPVSAPFHSSMMQPAEERLRKDIESIAFSDPGVPVYVNVDAEPVTNAAVAKEAGGTGVLELELEGQGKASIASDTAFQLELVLGEPAAQERPGITGMAHMFEHMAFKGTSEIGTASEQGDTLFTKFSWVF